jgi:hypothetical protein
MGTHFARFDREIFKKCGMSNKLNGTEDDSMGQ